MNTTAPTPYTPLRPARSCTLPVRGLDYHLLRWGEPRVDQPLLVLAHGWMDVAASYQFLVDALPPDYAIVAPDWRGFGATVVPQQIDHFLFADYLLDLDYLLDQLSPQQPVDLVGHSMGGNIATQYAGLRPERIRKLVNLEGFGLPATQAEQAPGRLRDWMQQVKAQRQGEKQLHSYPDQSSVAAGCKKPTRGWTMPRRCGWPASGHSRRPMAAGISAPMPHTRSPAPICTTWLKPMPCCAASKPPR